MTYQNNATTIVKGFNHNETMEKHIDQNDVKHTNDIRRIVEI